MSDNAFADAASPKAALERAVHRQGPANGTAAHPADRSAGHASAMPEAPTGALSRGGQVISKPRAKTGYLPR